MKKHLEKAHGIKQFHCTYCSQSFGMRGNLKKHIDEVHENLRPFECDICHGKFARKEKLREHIEGVHEKIKPFQCSSCDYRSHLKGAMTKHIAIVHKGLKCEVIFLGPKKHSCTLCDFTSGIRSDMKKHITEVHDGKQVWICSICNTEFTRKDNLQAHITQAHEGRKRNYKKRTKPIDPSTFVDVPGTYGNILTEKYNEKILPEVPMSVDERISLNEKRIKLVEKNSNTSENYNFEGKMGC